MLVAGRTACDGYIASMGTYEPEDDLEEGCLAGTIVADKGKTLCAASLGSSNSETMTGSGPTSEANTPWPSIGSNPTSVVAVPY